MSYDQIEQMVSKLKEWSVRGKGLDDSMEEGKGSKSSMKENLIVFNVPLAMIREE